MLICSTQIKIIKNYVLSFKKGKKIFTKLSQQEFNRYQKLLRCLKFESLPEIDFKVLVLMILFKENINTIQGLIKFLNELNKKQINEYLSIKEDLSVYQKYIYKTDDSVDELFRKYKNNEINLITLYTNLHNKEIKGRIKQKFYRNLSLFLDYFSKIKETIEGQQ